MSRKSILLLPAALALAVLQARAEPPASLMQSYASQAAMSSRAYVGPSAARGKGFFHALRKDWSCATCHTADPSQPGRHAVTGKPIEPLAPAANPRRLQDRAKVEKWFRRNCNDTLGRECTAAEKADVIAYLAGVGQGGRP